MKNKHLQEFVTADASLIQEKKDEAQSNLDSAMQALEQANNDADNDASSIYALKDVIELNKIQIARLETISPERIKHEVAAVKSQHLVARSNYLNFDSDESLITERVNLFHTWGYALIRAKICGRNDKENVKLWISEASLVHKQLAPKKGNHENTAPAEIWLNALAQTLKIFAKLEIDEGHSLMFLNYALAESL